MELLALLGVCVFFGIMFSLASYANRYYSANRIMRTRQLAYIKRDVGSNRSEESQKRIEAARWDIMLDK